MIYPRQKLYDIKFINFLKELLSFKINKHLNKDFEKNFSNFLTTNKEDIVPLPMGRLSLYLAVKASISENKRDVLMSPFTIYDMVNMVICAGGIPKFVDSSSPPHLTLKDIKKHITSKTCLVLITHYHTSNKEVAWISKFLKKKKIFLIEDCAISLGAKISDTAVGLHGDFALYSFGIFKFISCYLGGALCVKDNVLRKKISVIVNSWEKMSAKILLPHFLKALKFHFLTRKLVFHFFTFRIFKFGYLRDISIIKNQAKNDPLPQIRCTLDKNYELKPTNYQKREWNRQISNINPDREKRLENAFIYYQKLKNNKDITISKPSRTEDSFLNFPILSKQKNELIKYLMKNNIDVSPYFYRICSDEIAFKKFAVNCPNLRNYENQLIVLPNYPSLPKQEIHRITTVINGFYKELPSNFENYIK